MYAKEYTESKPYDKEYLSLAYNVVGKLPTAKIEIKTSASDDYGNYSIVIPDELNNRWNSYMIEVRDQNQDLIGTYTNENIYEFEKFQTNYPKKKLQLPYLHHFNDDQLHQKPS